MRTGDLTMLRSYVDQLRAAIDGFDEMLASVTLPKQSRNPLDADRPLEVVPAFYCANGHAKVIHLTPDCPVCAMRRLTGYSEKWCDACREMTAHVGGLHVHASCLKCLWIRQERDLAQAPGTGGPSGRMHRTWRQSDFS
jgi:hypothetical protein